MLRCPHKGCIILLKGQAGLMSHEWRCPFRNAKGVGMPVQKRTRKRRRRNLPISLSGTGPRLANDAVYALTESGSPVRPHEEAQQRIFNKERNVKGILEELVGPELPLGKEDYDEESERPLVEANEEEVGEALALLLNDFLKTMGSSKVDRLLFLIQHPSYKPESIMERFTSSSTLKEYVKEKLKDREKHFESMGFRRNFITDESGARCEVYLRDSVTVLAKQCEKSGRDNMFYEFFVEKNRKGERIYNHPLSGKLAERGFPEVKAAIKRCSKRDVCWNESMNDFIGAVQLYSDKSSTALSPNALTFYPLHLTLLNFSHELRHSLIQSGATKVAFLPVYLTDSTDDAIRDRATKMRLLHKALERILEPLFEASWSAFEYRDRERVFRRCYPILGNYITDYPEGKDITSTLGGSGTANPCTRCLVSKHDLGLCTPTSVEKRSVIGTLGVQNKARNFRSLAKKCGNRDDARNYRANAYNMLKRISISEQVPALTRWPFLTLHETLDLYTAMSFEPMHNLALGVGKLLKGCPPLRLGSEDLYSTEFRTSKGEPKQFSKIKVKVLSSVNSALKLIQEECAGSRFCVDFSNSKSNSKLNGFYTSDGIVGMLEAADFMCLDQVFPFVGALIDRMCGEVEEAPTTRVMTLYGDLLEFIYRRGQDPGHSKEDLEMLRSKINEFKNFSRALYGPFQTSGMGVPKFHMLDHLPDDIERLGSVLSMSAGVFESAHKEFKQEYKCTSRRKRGAMEETITGISENQSLKRMLQSPEKNDFSRMVARLVQGHRVRPIGSRPTAIKLEALRGGSAALVRRGECIKHEEIREYLRHCEKYNATGNLDDRKCRNFHGGIGRDLSILDRERFSPTLQALGKDIGVGGLKSLSALISKRACEGVPNQFEHMTILRSLEIERVQSGFVAGIDVPSAQIYETADRYGEFDKAIFSENGRRTIQRIVSSHSFYKSKRARLDCVMLEASCGDQGNDDKFSLSKDFELYFAKALAMFRVHACSGPFGRQSEANKELIFLRYFDIIPLSDNIDRALGCVKLRWALQPPHYSSEQSEPTPWYDLQSIATLRGRAQVIRGDFCLEQTESFKGKSHWKHQWFYVNRFAYDSSEPAYYEEDREDSVC